MTEKTELDLASFCTHGDLEWHGCYGSGAKYNKYTIPESVKHPAKMSFDLLERIFKHLESMDLLNHDSVVIDFMAGSGRTGTVAALRRHKTISVELEPHFIEMISGYNCDGKSISEFKIEPCVCKSDTLHKPHKIKTGLFVVECSGNPRIIPICRCGDRRHHKKHHVIGNKELLEQVMGRKVHWDVIMGDARELSRLLVLTDMVGVISPPYFSQVAYHDKEFILSIAEDKSQRYRDGRLKGHYGSPEAIRRYAEKIMETYSLDPRNIGNLLDSPLVGIMSPPYQDMAMPMGCPSHIRQLAREGKWDEAIELEKKAEAEQVKKGKKFAVSTDGAIRRKIEMALEREKGNYSENTENIGNLSDSPLVGIMSPPYSQAQQGGGIAINGYRGDHMHEQGKNQPDKVGQRCGYMKEVHGSDPGNIGNLPDRVIVGITSPPYESAIKERGRDEPIEKVKERLRKAGKSEEYIEKYFSGNPSDNKMKGVGVADEYSKDPDNIGNQQDESYLSAMLKVYQQAFLCGISPLVVVTKNPTRNGALRRLDLDTVHLQQLSGYEIFDYHRAILFESHKQGTLDGDTKDVHKGRLSFFKRLSLGKGNTVAQYEDIIFARIPIKCARPISDLRALDSGE